MKPNRQMVSATMVALLALSCASHAQTSPTRTAYKCSVNGKTVYTDSPCENAIVVDTTPTRGMNQSTGSVLKGEDVRREEFREQLSKAISPVANTTPAQMEAFGRRQKLSTEARDECGKLDKTMPGETDTKRLFEMRKRYRDLAC